MSKNIKTNKVTPNKPCLRCDLPESEDNMIGCQVCQNWLHNGCDPEIQNDEGAKIVEIYYCPPCRETGHELIKYKEGEQNKTPTKNETNQESTTEVDIAEEALHSPLLTPYQQPPDQEKEILEESNHDLTQLINSLPDPLTDDPNHKMKEIVEKIKNVSISKKKEKTTPKKPRKMVHRSRAEILKENTKLTKIIDKLTEEKEKHEDQIKEMENAMKVESEYRTKMEELEEKLKSKDDTSIEKVIYEAENCKQAQDKKIKELQSKVDDLRKKNLEKQNEIKELKKHNEDCLSEINTLKTSNEKETDLRTKTEELLRLTEEKTIAQESQITECSKNHGVKIEKLTEQLENQKDNEKQIVEKHNAEIKNLKENQNNDNIKMKELEKENMQLRLKKENPNQVRTQPNMLDDNVEMVQIIESLETQLQEAKEEIHSLTVKAVEGEIELKVRKELLRELNETYGKQIEQLSLFHSKNLEEVSNTYIQRILQYQKEVDSKAQKTMEEYKNNKDESQTVQKLTKQLEEKTEEAKILKNELITIGKKKYETIKKATQPPKRKQGLPNKYKNGCFMIAPLHALASIMEGEKGEEDTIIKHVAQVKQCIEGKKTEIDAEEIMTDIWEFSKNEWSQYKEEEGVCIQECATEYLSRAINNSELLKRKTETVYVQKTECKNPECQATTISPKTKTNINETYNTYGKEKLDLQTLVDELLTQNEEVCPHCHQDAKTIKTLEKAPKYFILSLPRHNEEGEKIETMITHKADHIAIKTNNEIIKYGAIGTIIHRGTQGSSGHYIYNQFNEKTNEWEQIDDHVIISGKKAAHENNQGSIFILQKLKPNPEKTQVPWKKPYDVERWEEVSYKRKTPYQKRENLNIPCKFFKIDKCREGERCKYLHQICREYQEGRCIYNDYCEYKHTKPTRSPQRKYQQY